MSATDRTSQQEEASLSVEERPSVGPRVPATVYVLEECSCSSMPGYRLAEFLKSRFRSTDVASYDSGDLDGTTPHLPPLPADLQAFRSARLPALVVDGKVYTEGWLPNFLDAVALIESSRPPSKPIQAQARAGGADGSSCR